jgi:electron transport complex protein RnfG
MREMLRYGFILALICTVASASLAVINSLTKSRIMAQAQAEEEAGLKSVITEGARFEPVKSKDEIIYYKAYDQGGNFLAVAFKAESKGYSSTIETMAGMTKEGNIIAIKILNQNETPGLGARIAEPEFTARFRNKDVQEVASVEAITGATISSRAVIDSVKKKAEEIKALITNEK